ncbi:hypothetical protein LP420_32805 [Massilia sp. B-10]|nr:hypothetical protein LP420_32805 [Massilia sp. B-10]
MQTYVFDRQLARRFGMREIPGTQWRNADQGVWEQYRWQIIGSVSLIALQAMLITALVMALRGRRRAMFALDRERASLEQAVGERTIELQAANNALEQQVTTDALTGIGNRRRMTAQISAELRTGAPVPAIRCRC